MMKVIFGILLIVGVCSAQINNAQTDYENSICECVPYYQCSAKGTANEDGSGVIDIRVGTDQESPTTGRRTCEHYLEVCCLPPDVDPGQQGGQNQGGQNQGGQNQGGQNQGGQNQGGQNQGGQNQGGNPNQQGGGQTGQGNHVNKGCGYRNPNGIGFRITGNNNNEANFAEYPWMVAILQRTPQGKVYTCGGSLIHRRVVLTGAHCVFGKSATDLTVRVGEWDTQTTNEPLPHQDRGVTVAITHPNFKSDSLHNDYAILVLESAVDLADNVEIACLPESNEYFDYSKCFATGWGKSDFGEQGKYQVILKAVELPVVPRDTCQKSLRTTRLGRYFKLDESFICAGGVAGVDTCKGDGGSPLVCPLQYDPSRYTQAGIVAWGIGCGGDGVPGVYADVARARPWIDQTLATYNIDSTSYSPGANNNYPPIQG